MTNPKTPDEIVKAALDRIAQDAADAFAYGTTAWKLEPRDVWSVDMSVPGSDRTAVFYMGRDGRMRTVEPNDVIEGEFKVVSR